MNTDDLTENNLYDWCHPARTWTDIHRARYYNQLIQTTKKRLEVLQATTAARDDTIALETATLSGAKKELKRATHCAPEFVPELQDF